MNKGPAETAALISHVVGEHGQVTSVEVDAVVAEHAAGNLREAGCRPRLLVGDGAEGCPDFAPFDRVHVTCGIRRVPYPWVEQVRPGGERDHQVYQLGDRSLWDELVDAYFRWVSWGEPGHERFGWTVSQDGGHSIWLDSPERVLTP
ncbi:hypothetical protein AB0C28_04270 [Nonomuraea sp. NPDC048892]|uniref:protein-L-isoaspartate O-methyltransferase family protein n=1 Tax=Nonomuraea sp. NPDC048892 TaxID=3154624 RepID=UPI003410486E